LHLKFNVDFYRWHRRLVLCKPWSRVFNRSRALIKFRIDDWSSSMMQLAGSWAIYVMIDDRVTGLCSDNVICM